MGCSLCIEPSEGVDNPQAFKTIDYAIMAAHERGIRVIIIVAGNCSYCRMSGGGGYVLWSGYHDLKRFFTAPRIIAAFEAPIRAVLNHRNVYTGIAYRDDPTIMAWESCKVCGLGAPGPDFTKNSELYLRWIDTIGSFIKSIEPSAAGQQIVRPRLGGSQHSASKTRIQQAME